MRSLRFGVLAESVRAGEELLDLARRAEAAGCSTLLIRDHLVEGPFAHQFAPLTALAFVAAATARLRVGTLVLSNDFRHPAVLAKEIATLDVLSGGRVELGLGAGFLQRDYGVAGLRFDPPGVRVARLEEALHVFKGLLAGGALTYDGRHYQVTGLDGFPKSLQRPHPPIHVAASRPRMLGIAAREANIINVQTVSTANGVLTDDPHLRSPQALARQIERVRAAAGDRFAQLELSGFATVVLTDDPRRAAAGIAQERGWTGTSGDDVLAMPTMFLGPPDHVAGLFHERHETFGLSYFILSDRTLDHALPVLDRLVSPG